MINNSLYKLSEIPNYYVYGYFLYDGSPLYIGMGKNNRGTSHLQPSVIKSKKNPFYDKLEELFSIEEPVFYRVIKDNLSRKEASIVEEVLVKFIGRYNNKTGELFNLKDGGITSPIESLLRPVVLYDYKTSKLIKTFQSISECSNFIKANKTTVRDALVGKYPTETEMGKFFIEDYKEPIKEFTNLKVQLNERINLRTNHIKEAVSKPLTFFSIKTNEVKVFETSDAARIYFRGCVKTFNKYINSNSLYRKEWRITNDK